jgi:hypothetical protein
MEQERLQPSLAGDKLSNKATLYTIHGLGLPTDGPVEMSQDSEVSEF